MNVPEQTMREIIVQTGRLVFQFQYTSGTGGNISARLAPEEFLITPSKVNKGFITSEDVIRINANLDILEGRGVPSSETFIHLAIYAAIPAAGGVIHAHPPYATAFAIRGEDIETAYVPEALVFLGSRVPLVPYATPSTREMADNLAPFLGEKTPAYLLENHGVLVWGKDLSDAFNNLQTLELYAKQLTIARLAGTPKAISPERLDAIRDLFGL